MKNFPSIKKTPEFRKIYDQGRSFALGTLVMYYKENDLGYNRLGISAGRNMGNSVERHRFYRRIREIFKTYDPGIKKGSDIVIIARKGSKDASFHKLGKDYHSLLKKHGLLIRDE